MCINEAAYVYKVGIYVYKGGIRYTAPAPDLEVGMHPPCLKVLQSFLTLL